MRNHSCCYLNSPQLEELRLSAARPNHIFLDGDNFLWRGSVEMYGEMFGKVMCLMANSSESAEMDLLGRNLFLNTLHLSDRERFDSMHSLLREREIPCAVDQKEYIRTIKEYFENNFRVWIVPAEGASELLDLLSRCRRCGINLSVHLLSLNMDFALPLIVEHFGWGDHFNGRLLGAPFLSEAVRQSKAEQAAQCLEQHAGLIVVAGDSVGDIAAGNRLREGGYAVLTLGATTGRHTFEELRAEHANVIGSSVAELEPMIRRLISNDDVS